MTPHKTDTSLPNNHDPSDAEESSLDLSPEERLFHEINLLRIEGYCFSFDPKSAAKRTGKHDFIELVKTTEGLISRPISVKPDADYGYPSTLAYKILQAVLKKLSDEGYEGADSASFSQRELARLVGRQSFGGANSKEFFRAVMQLNATRIWCSFFDKQTEEWRVLTFTLFTEALFSGRKHKLTECVLTLHPRIVASLRNRHYFCLNYNRLTRLEPIGMALFKHLFFQMSRTYSKLKDPSFSYERDYEAICASWLGDLKVLRYKSDILKDQLGRHLQDLKRVGLIKSATDVIERNASGGYKLVVKPGPGFFEDYERYYGTHRQLPFPFKRTAEEHSIKRPLELLSYFHKKRLGVDDLAQRIFPEKETAFARILVEKYPDELCREIVDYGLKRSSEQKAYNPQTLAGIGQFINEFFATKSERERKAAERVVREEHHLKEATLERQKEAYEIFYKMEIQRVRESLSAEELEALEKPLRAEYRAKYPGALAALGDMYVWFNGNGVLQQKYKVPTFEEWQTQNHA
jgi:hypothetical protein